MFTQYNAMKPLLIVFIMILGTLSYADEPLDVGSVAPAPEVTIHTGEKIPLADIYKKGPTLVYFYPKADTPGCTRQACNLRDNFSALREAGVQVLGVSYDDASSQKEFAEKYELPFVLVADGEDDYQLGKAFGVGGMLGGLMNAYKRQSFLVVDGKIAWRDLKATPASQTEDVLKALKKVER